MICCKELKKVNDSVIKAKEFTFSHFFRKLIRLLALMTENDARLWEEVCEKGD